MDVLEAKKLVIKAGRELSQSGLITRTWGNVSCRTGAESFVISASGKEYMTLTEDEVIQMKIEDLSYEGDIKPSSENRIHGAVYRLKEEAGFVIHTHQVNASAVSAMGLDALRLDSDYRGIGREIVCADYGLPGSGELCKHTVAAIKKSGGNTVILKNHGALCFGEDYDETFQVAHQLENACGFFLQSISPHIKENWDKGCEEVREGETAVWNQAGIILEFAELLIAMRPYVDDFAQIVGTKIKTVTDCAVSIESAIKSRTTVIVKDRGALCCGATLDESRAISSIVEKNCLAFFAALAAGDEKPIKRWECLLMRQIYLKKYSKLKD